MPPATTARLRILHLIDNTTPGSVMRVVEHISSSPALAQVAQQVVRVVGRGEALPHCDADLVISHLTINWRSLPRIAFRAGHSAVPICHVEHSYTEAFTAHNVPFKARFFTLCGPLMRCSTGLLRSVRLRETGWRIGTSSVRLL